MFRGIDIGTASVRLYGGTELEKAIGRKYHGGGKITQSSVEIWQAITEVCPLHDIKALAIAATCSMVVREVVEQDGEAYLVPFNCGSSTSDDVILWMDSRAAAQCSSLNEKLPGDVLAAIGGAVIPEMGLAKLKWLSENYPTKHLVAFEMYDWFSYVFINGIEDSRVPSHPAKVEGTHAMDGSIKGWSSELLRHLGITVEIGSTSAVDLPPVGTPVGTVHRQFTEGTVVVGHGCIDCYGGWLSMNLASGHDSTLSMVAGTSTCFLLLLTSPHSVPGIWGPYPQLLGRDFPALFEFGQPATGALLEELYEESGIDVPDVGHFIDVVEARCARLEAEKGSLVVLFKDHFYYGDKHGNRSPFNDFDMSEVTMGGAHPHDAVVLRYHLILEFLVLQTKQIIDIIEQHQAPIRKIVISGSQARNPRLVALLQLALPAVSISIASGNQKLHVARGASLAAEVAWHASHGASYASTMTSVLALNSHQDVIEAVELTEDKSVLDTKYWFLDRVSRLQAEYRQRIRGLSP